MHVFIYDIVLVLGDVSVGKTSLVHRQLEHHVAPIPTSRENLTDYPNDSGSNPRADNSSSNLHLALSAARVRAQSFGSQRNGNESSSDFANMNSRGGSSMLVGSPILSTGLSFFLSFFLCVCVCESVCVCVCLLICS